MSIDADFDKRVRKVVQTHERKKRNGVVHRLRRDGLIVTQPRMARPRFPVRGIVVVLTLGVVFKTLLWAQFDTSSYNERIEALRGGSIVDQAGAWIMQEDRLTSYLGEQVRPYLSR